MNWIGKEEIITSDTEWIAPEARNQKFQVTLYGAGGSGSCDGNYFNHVGGAGGGSGEMTFKEITLNQGTRVSITIGQGGKGVHDSNWVSDYIDRIVGQSGGTTFFGNYACANGGLGGNINVGGQGGHQGGDSGENADGNYIGYGVNVNVGEFSYSSGGGAPSINARGVGGCANRSSGNAGTGGGGCGMFIERVDSDNQIHRRIGSGGDGVCVIRYYAPIK